MATRLQVVAAGAVLIVTSSAPVVSPCADFSAVPNAFAATTGRRLPGRRTVEAVPSSPHVALFSPPTAFTSPRRGCFYLGKAASLTMEQPLYFRGGVYERSGSGTASADDFTALLEWLDDVSYEDDTDAPATRAPLRIAPSTLGPNTGHGLFATRPFSADETIFVLPRYKCLALDDALEDHDAGHAFRALAEYGGAAGAKTALAGKVAMEWLKLYHQGRKGSEWGPYLSTLSPWHPPEDRMDHVLWWDDDSIEDLWRGSAGYEEVVKLRDGVDCAVDVLREVLVEAFHDSWDEIEDADVDGAVRAAFVAIFSRAFEDFGPEEEEDDGEFHSDKNYDTYGKDQSGWDHAEDDEPVDEEEVDSFLEDEDEDDLRCAKLLPVLDMTQHLPSEANIDHYTDSHGDVIVTALCDLEAGDELFNDYDCGSLEPRRFFAFYGFVPGETRPGRELLRGRSSVFFPRSEKELGS